MWQVGKWKIECEILVGKTYSENAGGSCMYERDDDNDNMEPKK
jgi:hypothetical protein